MKKTILPALLCVVSLVACAGAYAADTPVASPSPAAKPAPKAATVFCAVTGEKIGDPSKSAGTSVYNGKTYYFCCAGCKPQFDKDPAKFAKAADAKAAESAPKKVEKKPKKAA